MTGFENYQILMKPEGSVSDLKKYKKHEKLRDGRSVVIRAIHSTDKLALLDGFHRLSKESIHSRFFGGKQDLSEGELKFFTEVDFQSHVALVVEMVDNSMPIAVGRFFRTDEDTLQADVAITVDEDHHGLGIGTLLFRHLIETAQLLGIKEFTADILYTNAPMLRIIHHLKYPMKKKDMGDYESVRIMI